MPGRQEAEALLEEHEADEQHDGADRGLVHDAPDEGDQAEPRQEEVDEAVDQAVDRIGLDWIGLELTGLDWGLSRSCFFCFVSSGRLWVGTICFVCRWFFGRRGRRRRRRRRRRNQSLSLSLSLRSRCGRRR